MKKLTVLAGIILSFSLMGCDTTDASQEDALLSRANSYLNVLAPNNTFKLPKTLSQLRSDSWGYQTDELMLQFDENDTNSLQYFTLDFSRRPSPNRDEEKISKAEVIKIVRETLDALNIHLAEAPGVVLEIKEDYINANPMGYMFVGTLTYNEIPVLGGVSGILATKDGSIQKFATIPFLPPEPIANPISEEQAIKLAQQFLLDNKQANLKFHEIRQSYDRPNQFTDRERAPKANEFRLFWHVTFKSEDTDSHAFHAHPTNIMVDAETGKVTLGII